MTKSIDRRKFIKQAAAAGVGLGVAGHLSVVRGARVPADTVVVGVMGVNGRGNYLAEVFAQAEGAAVGYVCDVDERAVQETIENVAGRQDLAPEGVTDFRRILDDPDIDALVIAAPDHWHTPAAILAMDAGKHVYVEKPCSHNPREGELLVEAQQKYSRVVQMGNQQRSAPRSIEVIQEIRAGLIGRPYYARAWYANTRGSIGEGQPAEVPAWLDWELWQGPAPRTDFRDNLVHYNWHWFWNWGTGEICNNGTHEIDVCRWALDVDYPQRVTSAGGRYHYDDDWQFYDTQVVSYDFGNDTTIAWEGRSCNGYPIEGRGRGASIHGTEGTVILDRDGYVVYDLDNNEVRRNVREEESDALNTTGGGSHTDLHVADFLQAIRDGGQEALNSPISEGRKSVLLCHLGNIAQHTGRTLTCDPQTGRLQGDDEAMEMWSREYAPDWEPKV